MLSNFTANAESFSVTFNSVLGQDMQGFDPFKVSKNPDSIASFTNPFTGKTDVIAIADGTNDVVWFSHKKNWKATSLFPGVSINAIATVKGYNDDETEFLQYFFAIDGKKIHISYMDKNEKISKIIEKDCQATSIKAGFLGGDNFSFFYGKTPSGDICVGTIYPFDDPFIDYYEAPSYFWDGNPHLLFSDPHNWDAWWLKEGDLQSLSKSFNTDEAQHQRKTPLPTTLRGANIKSLIHAQRNGEGIVAFTVENGGKLAFRTGDTGDDKTEIGACTDIRLGCARLLGNDGKRCDLFGIDGAGRLWSVRSNEQQTSGFEVPVPIAGTTAMLSIPDSTSDATILFSQGSDGTLRFHQCENSSSGWLTGRIQIPAEKASQSRRYRIRVNLTDAGGYPAPAGTIIRLSLKDTMASVDVEIGGVIYVVGGGIPTEIPLTSPGTFSLSVAGTDLTPTVLTITGDGVTTTDIDPAAATRSYFDGTKPLNPLGPNGGGSAFNADTLKSLSDGKLADDDAARLRDGIISLQTMKPSASGLGFEDAEGSGRYGFSLSLRGASVGVRLFTSAEEAASHHAATLAASGSLSFDISGWASDAWDAVKNFVTDAADIVVDIAAKTASFVIKLGDVVINLAKLAIDTVAHVASVIGATLTAIAGEFEKILEFLKSLFDLKAIWRTKLALESALNDTLDSAATDLDKARAWITANIEKAKQDSDQFFDQIIASYGQAIAGKTTPTPQTTLAGGVSWGALTSNPDNHWLADKFPLSQNASAIALTGAHLASQPATDKWITGWNSLKDDFAKLLTDLTDTVAKLIGILEKFAENHADLLTTGVTGLLEVGKGGVDIVLDALEALIDGFFTVAELCVAFITEILTIPLDIPIISDIWSWIANEAGHGSDPLTVGGVIALAAAFPVTILYKMLAGGHEPFPDAAAISSAATNGKALGALSESSALIVAGVCEILEIFAAFIDLTTKKGPINAAAKATNIALETVALMFGYYAEHGSSFKEKKTLLQTFVGVVDLVAIGLEISATLEIGEEPEDAEAAREAREQAAALFTSFTGLLHALSGLLEGQGLTTKLVRALPGAQLFVGGLPLGESPTATLVRSLLIFGGHGVAGALSIIDAEHA